jgi:hypothetical protein
VANDSEDEVKVSDASATQRRVYALPGEMVERIVEYQKEKGFQSEVEAVRRLLDEALKSRDTPEKVLNRFLARLEAHRVVSEAAKDVLVGHPMVESMRWGPDEVSFQIKGAPEITVRDNGAVTLSSPAIEWQTKHPFGPGRLVNPMDDVPF